MSDRTNFIPHLYVQTELCRPTFITGAALMGVRQKYVALPDEITSVPLPQQYTMIAAAIRQHYADRRGECPLFGAITGYVYRRTPEQATLFTVAGQIEVEHLVGFREDGAAVARIGRHPVEFR